MNECMDGGGYQYVSVVLSCRIAQQSNGQPGIWLLGTFLGCLNAMKTWAQSDAQFCVEYSSRPELPSSLVLCSFELRRFQHLALLVQT